VDVCLKQIQLMSRFCPCVPRALSSLCHPVCFLTLHLAAGLWLCGFVLFTYVEETVNFRLLMDQITEASEKAQAVSCSAISRGIAVSGLVFFSCDVTSTPNLNTAPELGPVRSLLSPGNAKEPFIAYRM